jgi:hypothetical protein
MNVQLNRWLAHISATNSLNSPKLLQGSLGAPRLRVVPVMFELNAAEQSLWRLVEWEPFPVDQQIRRTKSVV